MALEGEELTALTVEQKSEGVQHRERVATHLAQEKKWSMSSSTWPVLVVLITNIVFMLVSLILAVLTEDTMCIITAAMTGIVVFLCLLAVFSRPSFKDTDTFNNQEAVCLFHSRVSSDDPAFKRFCDQQIPRTLAIITKGNRYRTALLFFGYLRASVPWGLVGIGVLFGVIISEFETLLCSLGLGAELGIGVVLMLWVLMQELLKIRKESNHEDLVPTECSLRRWYPCGWEKQVFLVEPHCWAERGMEREQGCGIVEGGQ